MWPLLTAPLLVLLPARWRKRAAPGDAPINLRIASAVIGVVQCVTGFLALAWWYSWSAEHWTSHVVSRAADAHPLTDVAPYQLGLLGLTLFASSPITWLVALWSIEGVARILAAAITSEIFATLPLALIAAAIALFRPQDPDDARSTSPAHGFAAFLRRLLSEKTHAPAPDVLTPFKDAHGELLRVASSHTKPDWEAGRILYISGDFYRMDELTERYSGAPTHPDGAARPFLYKLRRLEAGVLTPRTLRYDPPADALTRPPQLYTPLSPSTTSHTK
jgi:hypothetical protein